MNHRHIEVIRRTPERANGLPPLLFVHGAWHGGWCWEAHFLDYFAAQGFEVAALSLRGHGGSAAVRAMRWNRIADYVVDVAQVAGTMATPPVVIGHSMGGLVVQKYLESQPSPAAALLASVPPQGVWRTALRLCARHPWLFLKTSLTLSLWPLVSTPALAHESFFHPQLDPALVQRYHQRMTDESFMGFLDMLFLNLPRPSRVRTPVAVLGAADDQVFSVQQVADTARAYGSQPVIFEGMAHDMMLEAGWQPVADHLIHWLQRELRQEH